MAMLFCALVLCFGITAAVIIIKIGGLKARQRRAFKQLILVFPAPKALETPKLVS